ncbi:MAG: succinyl-diaminopimelate desuccinylase [Caulobacteraceae bacterium]|nr:succinyl-diaminopimelate desuccinylase [Caulobacter sp.]
MVAVDPVALACALVRAPSVTPVDAGAMEAVEQALAPLGFALRRLRFGEVENLYARRGAGGRNLMFAGHVDVVPAGDPAAWRAPPFAGEVRGGVLVGRGAVDMKGAVAAWIAALARTPAPAQGVQSLLITGDEEGAALDGTRRVVEALLAEGERVDHCLVGEPTSAAVLGDMMKTGRRGSLNASIVVEGVQGHVAYPDRAANPIPVLVALLQRLQGLALDAPWAAFQPSNLEVTNIHVGNTADNVIPAEARARLNIRFNPAYRGEELVARLEVACAEAAAGFAGAVRLEARVSGEAFHTPDGPFVELVAAAVEAVTGQAPERSTSGGTSDARFIRALCPVVEFGLVGATMHKVDEAAPVADLLALSEVYAEVNRRYFA